MIRIHLAFTVFGVTANFAYRTPLFFTAFVVVVHLTVEYPRFRIVMDVDVDWL